MVQKLDANLQNVADNRCGNDCWRSVQVYQPSLDISRFWIGLEKISCLVLVVSIFEWKEKKTIETTKNLDMAIGNQFLFFW